MRTKKSVLRSLTLGASLAASIAGVAHAQDATESEEIVVTAQKREERLRDVPISIVAIDAETLTDRRVDSIDDLVTLVPGLEAGTGYGGFSSNISIRGMAPQNFGTATVVTFIDGFTTGLRSDSTSALFDLERVEVLRGPQATLYGRNAIGGTINYITRAPGNDTEGSAQFTYGTYDAYAVRGSFSAPIVEDLLAFRVSAAISGRDGFYDNALTGDEAVDDEENTSARMRLRLTPGTRFESNLAIAYTDTDNGCGDCSFGFTDFDELNPTAVGSGGVDFSDVTEALSLDLTGHFRREIVSAVWTNSYDFDGFSLTSLTGYADQKIDLLLDFNFGPGDYFGVYRDSNNLVDTQTISQELRLASTDEGRFQWLLGAYWFEQEQSFGSTSNTTLGPLTLSSLEDATSNQALFLNASYDLNAALELGFGLRYDREQFEQSNLLTGTTDRAESEELLPRVSLLWRASPDLNVYGSIARGYHSGGTNPSSPFFGAPPSSTYDPEFVTSYEVGVKGGAQNLSYEVAAFYTDWQDQQVTSTAGVLTYIVNAGQSEIYGLEGIVRARLSDSVSLDASAAWMHARYEDFLDLSGAPTYFGAPAQRAGERLPQAPDFSAAIGLEYETPISREWNFRARGDVRYTGRRALDASSLAVADGVAVADFMIGVGTDRLRLSAYATNAFDEEYANFARLFAGFRPLVQRGDPQQFGVQLDYSF